MSLKIKLLFKSPSIHEQFTPDGKIVLHCGDTLKFIETLPDETIKLIITSPPYNLGKIYESKTHIDSYLDFQKQAIEQMVRVLRRDGSICWQVGNFVDNSEVFPHIPASFILKGQNAASHPAIPLGKTHRISGNL